MDLRNKPERHNLHQIHASAGSGKTYTLTMSYLNELARIKGNDPQSMASAASGILAVTFTNAAANEMRERVIRMLKETALGMQPKDLSMTAERAAQWLAVFLRDYGALNIRTIDSLLHQIIRAAALELDISPNYETIFEAKEALRPLLDKNLDLTAQVGAQQDLFRTACQLMAESGGFGKGQDLATQIENMLEAAVLGTYDDLAEVSTYDALLDRLRQKASAKAAAFNDEAGAAGLQWAPKKQASLAKYIRATPPKEISKALLVDDCGALFQAGPVPSPVGEAYEQFVAAAAQYHSFCKIEPNARKLMPLIQFAAGVAHEFLATQKESGAILQNLVSRYACQALAPGQPLSDALCRMGSRLTCALIDEFQDTSVEQWQALRPLVLDALARGGAMTWVGDVKQSIYGWRGGDARLFDAPLADAELRAIAASVNPDKLQVNRRSRKEIVEHNNTFFAPLANAAATEQILLAMLPANPPKKVVAEARELITGNYSDYKQDPWKDKGSGGYVMFQSFEAGNREEDRQRAAQELVALLQGKIAGRRPWSDVLVLVRSKNEATLAVEKLSQAHIPVITENGLQLSHNHLLAETAAFLRFLLQPKDDVAFWLAISGDIIGSHPLMQAFSQLDMGVFAQDRRPLYQKFRELCPEAWQNLLAPFYSQAGLLTAYDTIREYFLRLQVQERFPADVTMLRRFLEMAHGLENNGDSSLADFMRYWDEYGSEEKAPMPERMDAVRVMTIHKAKGLQAAVVIIPSTGFTILPPRLPVVEEFDGARIPAKSTTALGYSHYRGMALQAAETLNLLYVAMTRAEEELYINHFGNFSKKRASLDKAVDELLPLANLSASYEYGIRPWQEDAPQEPPARAPHAINLFKTARLSGKWRPMQWLPKIRIFRNQLAAAKLTANERGILTHAAMERINFDFAAPEAARAALDMALRSLGMNIGPAERDSILQALVWFAGLPQARLWRQTGWPEHSLLQPDGEIVRPDLIVPHGPLIIDYKTGQPHESHVEQVRNYIACLAASGQFEQEPTGLLVYLDLQRIRKITAGEASELLAAHELSLPNAAGQGAEAQTSANQ